MKQASIQAKCNSATGIIGVHMTMYLEHLKAHNYSIRTLDVYGRALDDLDRYLRSTGIDRMEDIGPDTIDAFHLSLIERGFKPESQNTYMRAVKGMFSHLAKNRLIFINPTRSLLLRAVPRGMQRVPTENEIKRMMKTMDLSKPVGVRNRAILEVAYGSGLRRAEIASLTRLSVDLPDATVRVLGKGQCERVVPLTAMAVQILGIYIQNAREKLFSGASDRLWMGRYGPLSVEAITAICLEASERAGIYPAIRTHAIRRACATHMLRRGANPVDIQHLLGHRSLRHLGQYLAVSIRELRQIHAACNPGR